MLSKFRRNSKQLFESKRSTSISSSASVPTTTLTKLQTQRRKVSFFDLPAELRNIVYEDVARETAISIPFSTNRNGKKGTTVGRLRFGTIPALLIVSKQARREYLPVLLQFATVQVMIKDFDFRNLIRMHGSLYNIELKTLRQNDRLTVQLYVEKCNADSIVHLRRWLDDRATGLDRLPWRYSIYWKYKYQIIKNLSDDRKWHVRNMRRKVLEQNLEGIAQLHKNVHENLQFELQPIVAAYEGELERMRLPLERDLRVVFEGGPSISGARCSCVFNCRHVSCGDVAESRS